MQWCNRPHAKKTTRFYFSFCNWGSSLLVCSLFTKWQARKQSSFANNVQITLMHLSSITVQTLRQTHRLQALGWQVFYTLWSFLIVPLEWPGQASDFHWTKLPNHLWVLIQFRECTCHLLRALSVTLWGLHWPYERLSMHNSCRGKTQLNKSHTGSRLSAQINELIFNELIWTACG